MQTPRWVIHSLRHLAQVAIIIYITCAQILSYTSEVRVRRHLSDSLWCDLYAVANLLWTSRICARAPTHDHQWIIYIDCCTSVCIWADVAELIHQLSFCVSTAEWALSASYRDDGDGRSGENWYLSARHLVLSIFQGQYLLESWELVHALLIQGCHTDCFTTFLILTVPLCFACALVMHSTLTLP